MKYKDDVIVIGSGIGGLTCAASLAKKGYKVRVFERLNQSGGYVNTFKRGNYWFEGSTHQLGGFNDRLYLKNELKKLDLDIPFIRLSDSFEAFYFNKNKLINRYFIKSGYKESINSFKNYFNDKNIKKILNLCRNISKESLKLRRLSRDNKFFHIFDYIFLCLLKSNNLFINNIGKKYYINFYNYRSKSYKDLLGISNNEDYNYLLSLYCYFYILSSPSKLSALLISHLVNNFILDKPLFIKGGTKNLIEKLVNIINCNGGSINYNCNVDEIIIKNNEAVGVCLTNNKKYFSKYIVSNADAFTTYTKLIKTDLFINDEFKYNIKNYKPSRSVFQIFLGLPYDLKDYGFNASTMFFTNTKNIDYLYENDCKNNSLNSFIITNYSMMDEGFSKKGTSSIIIAEFSNSFDYWNNLDKNKYKMEKIKKQNELLNNIIKITGIPFDKYDICFSATPKTMHYYSGKYKGSTFGAEKNFVNNVKFDNISFINNLFLVGADTGNSGSITSTFYSAIITSDNIVNNNINK